MLERIYISIWGIYFIALTLFVLSGLLTAETAIIFGFILFCLTYIGMMGILPDHVSNIKPPLKH